MALQNVNSDEAGSQDTHIIPIISYKDPELRRDFRRVAASTEEIKDGRDKMLHICDECKKTSDSGAKLLKCSRMRLRAVILRSSDMEISSVKKYGTAQKRSVIRIVR